MERRYGRWRRRALAAALGVAAVGLGLGAFWPPSPEGSVGRTPASFQVTDRSGELLRAYLAPDDVWCLPLSLDAMGRWLPLIAVEVEDRRFFSHSGVDPWALGRAAWQNLTQGRVVSGASTITSQLVRLSSPTPRPRTWPVKVEEFLGALTLERHLSKETILESYLNKAPFGGNLRGVEAASRAYFGKRARYLAPSEAALLVGLLQSPTLFRPDRHPEAARRRRDHILRLLRSRDLLDDQALALALRDPIPPKLFPFPLRAPHGADLLRATRPDEGVVRSTLEAPLQRTAERLLLEALTPFPGSVAAAAMVVENATGAVRAYVGNARWGGVDRGNWVDCGDVPRSPGSALKPFAYLRAFERGLLAPGSLLADTPLGMAGRSPRNFDRKYRGAVSARDALADSLNVPAVRVLRLIRGNDLLALLRRWGFNLLKKDSDHYGDALVLGGCEVTLRELAQAYAALGAGGVFHPLRWEEDAPEVPGVRLCSAASAFLVADILSDLERLPGLVRDKLRGTGLSVAFKTGTSYGLRDAWTVAFSPRFTVAVWFGDTGGTPRDGLGGLLLAAPQAVRLLEEAERGKPRRSFVPPPEVGRRRVCTLSGSPLGEACPASRLEWEIVGVSPGGSCALHERRGGEVVTLWPPELEGFLRGGVAAWQRAPLAVTSPLAHGRYVFLPTPEGAPKIPLVAEGGNRGELFWFVDGVFFARQGPGESLFWPLPAVPGEHRVSVADGSGGAAGVTIVVETGKSP